MSCIALAKHVLLLENKSHTVGHPMQRENIHYFPNTENAIEFLPISKYYTLYFHYFVLELAVGVTRTETSTQGVINKTLVLSYRWLNGLIIT